MEQAKYEEKFIVIPIKHLRRLPVDKQVAFEKGLKVISPFLPENNYYVCNQDELYAPKVIEIILDGENAKKDFIYQIRTARNPKELLVTAIGLLTTQDAFKGSQPEEVLHAIQSVTK